MNPSNFRVPLSGSSVTTLGLKRRQRFRMSSWMFSLGFALLGSACGGVDASVEQTDAAVSNNADAATPDAMALDAAVACEPRLALIRFDTFFDIFTVDPDGTGLTNITNTPDAGEGRPEWSPDGQRIAFVMAQVATPGINIMNADGSNKQFLVAGGFHKWSPGGTALVFTRRVDDQTNVFKINADGTGEVQLTSQGGTEPIWTPDGGKVIFHSTRDGDLEIFSMNPDGTAQTNLTDNDVVDDDPSVSPDGTKIVFRSGPTAQTTNLRVMNLDGSGAASYLVGGPRESSPSFSPDGTKLVFQADNEIVVSNPNASDPVTVATGLFPSWSPNGDAIAYQDSPTTGAGVADPTVADSGVAITDGGSSASVVWQPCGQ